MKLVFQPGEFQGLFVKLVINMQRIITSSLTSSLKEAGESKNARMAR